MKRGRHPKLPGQRFETRSVKLPPEELDVVCRIAVREGKAIHAILRRAVRLLIAREIHPPA